MFPGFQFLSRKSSMHLQTKINPNQTNQPIIIIWHCLVWWSWKVYGIFNLFIMMMDEIMIREEFSCCWIRVKTIAGRVHSMQPWSGNKSYSSYSWLWCGEEGNNTTKITIRNVSIRLCVSTFLARKQKVVVEPIERIDWSIHTGVQIREWWDWDHHHAKRSKGFLEIVQGKN